MKKTTHAGIILFVASLLIAVIFMDTWIVFRMTSQQTKESGTYQLESISGKLQGTISDAETLTLELALEAGRFIENKEKLKEFLYAKKEALINQKNGVINVFMAGEDWMIIPDFDIPNNFNVQERIWYKGGIKNAGTTYVSAPYQDAVTGDVCYTVSVMLADGKSILGVDYSMENIQAYIAEMYNTGSRDAVIITDEGIIAGCSNKELIGQKQTTALPDYSFIYSLAKSQNEVVTTKLRSDFLYDSLFATKSGNGWYLIVSQNDWEMYRNSYIQLFTTIALSLALFLGIIILYFFAVRSQKRAENALESKEEFLNGITGELREPLRHIMEYSSKEHVVNSDNMDEDFARIHMSGEKLSEMIGQIISYSSIIRTDEKHTQKKSKSKGMNKRFRTLIVVLMLLVMVISSYSNMTATYRWGNVQMQSVAKEYEFQLSEWINSQKSILDMFCSVISTNPEMLDDYEGTVAYLNRITRQYPNISVSYMTNPNREHTVYMNNGWEPDASWHVEDRQWYIDTLASEAGWSISAPYYDEQTGGYCVTISEIVYDDETGAFLGVFGIDFFMDKLVEILGDSYSNNGYAFLVDTNGHIINHPNGNYQMSQDEQTNVTDLAYNEVVVDGITTKIIKDYDNSYRILLAIRNEASNFSVYVTSGIWQIYGRVVTYGLFCIATFVLCIVLVYRLLTGLIHWQNETNKQMKEAADTAIAAGKAKSQFLAQMSHEIRTPINAVLGMNEMILRESPEEKIQEYAKNIQAAGKNLLSVINSILDFSKIEDGKMEIIPVKYDLALLIHNLVNSISTRAKAKSLEFIVDIDETLPSVLLGDDVRITQVIMNLLTNAIKYTEEGRVIFSVKDNGRDADYIYLKVTVKDTGIGIKEEDLGKLFESFARLEEKRNRNIEGTGLGMAIVTRLLSMMESELQVDSIYGKGTEFSFVLKQSIIETEPIGNYLERLEKGVNQSENKTHLYAPDAKILVVDDNAMNRLVVKKLLQRNGIVPDLADSGEEAIEKIRNTTYNIVFMDHMMPKMDGIETLEKLHDEQLLHEDVIVIALTANAILGARETYLEAGFDDYLSKPIEVEQLEAKIEKHLPPEMVTYQPDEKN
ncbi:MAG: response regulator [Lachnospiraceae bacterium]|nr:response regulator [Lachnospiraceae bacterium]